MRRMYDNFFNGFFQYLQFEKRYSKHTITAYQTDLQQFAAFLEERFDGPDINNISAVFIRSWLVELRNEDISAKSLHRKISALKSFYKYLLRQGIVQVSPLSTIALPKIPKRLPIFVGEKEMENFLQYATFSDDWMGHTERLIVLLFYASGIRLSELIHLKVSHVDVANSHIKVLGKGNKERIIPVGPVLLSQITTYMSVKSNAVPLLNENLLVDKKGKPLYARLVYNIVKRQLGAITTIKKKSPHVLRHTFATHLSNNGAELNAIKELLGHSSLAATQIYTHNTIEKLKEVYKKAHPKG